MKVISDHYQRDCLIQFLMGLHDSFSNVQDQIMLIDPLPPVTKVFSYIQQWERHQLITSATPSIDSVALVAQKFSSKPSNFAVKRDKPYCSHCKIVGHTLAQCFNSGNVEASLCTHCEMNGHTADRCYKLHSYSPGHKLHKPCINVVAIESPDSTSSSESNMALTKEQYNELIVLLHNWNSPTSLFANHLQTIQSPHPYTSNNAGTSCCLSSSFNSSTPWIIDKGATNHTVCSPSFFTHITSSVSYFVKLPNGYFTPITHVGIVQVIANEPLLFFIIFCGFQCFLLICYLLESLPNNSTVALNFFLTCVLYRAFLLRQRLRRVS